MKADGILKFSVPIPVCILICNHPEIFDHKCMVVQHFLDNLFLLLMKLQLESEIV